MVLAAKGKSLADFGLRSAHGAEAGLLAARASYIAGFSGAANVEAGERFGIPVVGTMAHSFVQIHDDESAAFENFARSRPDGVNFPDRHVQHRSRRPKSRRARASSAQAKASIFAVFASIPET